jgi:uncharacterized protein
VLLAVAGIALIVLLQVAMRALVHVVPRSARSATTLAAELVICTVLVCAYRGAVRLLEHRTAAEIAARGSLRLLLPGALLGSALFALVYAILWAMGFAHYRGLGQAASLIGAFGSAAAAGVGEEIVFRGIVFRLVDERFGTTAALVFSAALFGALHGANPGATVVSTVAIALEAGVLLAAGYAMVRSLWFPIGLHFAWNFTEGGVFGAAVSGGQSEGLLRFPLSGPRIYTGGDFGPEASIVAMIVCLAAAVLLICVTVRRGYWRAFQLRAPAAPRH